MLTFIKLRKSIGDRISFDKWTDYHGRRFLIHYDFYNNQMDIKNENFVLCDTILINPLMFFNDRPSVQILKYALEN